MHSVLHISRVVIVKREGTSSPTKLTVAYKGWWQTPKVHLRLALDPVPKGAQQLREAGVCELQQRFSRGRGPMLRVKGDTKKLVLRLYKAGSLKTQAETILGDLLSRTAEAVTKIPFELKEGGKLVQAFVEMEQISPNPTPLPPPLLPIAFKFLSRDTAAGETVFPPAREPTPFRLKQLLADMYGPHTDTTDWSKPFMLDPETVTKDDASHDGTQTLHTTACSTDTGSSTDYDTADDDAAPSSEYDTADDDAAPSSEYDTTDDDAGPSSDYDTTDDEAESATDYDAADDDAWTQDSDQDADDEWTSLTDEDLASDQENSPLLLDLTSDQENSPHLLGLTSDQVPSSPVLFQPLPLPRLSTADKSDILGGRWLSDDVIDLAQEILQRRFPETRGLYASGAAFTLPPLQPGATSLFLQVVNRSAPLRLDSMADYGRLAGTHWLLLSSYGARRSGQLAVYDSMYSNLSACTTALVEQLQELHVPQPGAIMRPVQRQNDGHSCGLFALAFAFSIAVGQDPCTVRYDRASMAPHLVQCLERGIVQPFPAVPAGRGR